MPAQNPRSYRAKTFWLLWLALTTAAVCLASFFIDEIHDCLADHASFFAGWHYNALIGFAAAAVTGFLGGYLIASGGD